MTGGRSDRDTWREISIVDSLRSQEFEMRNGLREIIIINK